NATGWLGGEAVQPAGSCSVTMFSTAALESLTTVTRISRRRVGRTTGAPCVWPAPVVRVFVDVGVPLVATTSLRRVSLGDEPAICFDAAVARSGEATAGMIAISGDTRTEYAGTTSRSERFSPLSSSPSYRYCTGNASITSSAPLPL